MRERGITIVSLVITIIIILIISGVTIDALTGKYGIIGMTVKTKRKAEISSERENIKLAVIRTMQDDQNLKSEKNRLEQNLTKTIGKNETELREDANGYLVKIIKTKRYYRIREDGEVELVGDASDVEKNMQNIKLGDNLLNLTKLKNNTYISSENGSECESSGWSSSDYIYVGDYKNILIVSDNNSFLDRYNALYNENKELSRVIGISKKKITNDILGQINISISVLNIKENEKYIRISQQNSVIEHIKIYPILNEDFNNVIEFDINRSLIDEYSYGENIFENGKVFFATLGYASEVIIQDDKSGIGDDAVSVVLHKAIVYMPFAELVDIAKEIERLEKEVKRLNKELARVNGMLANPNFVSKAPEKKINEEKEKQAKYQEMMKQVQSQLENLKK